CTAAAIVTIPAIGRGDAMTADRQAGRGKAGRGRTAGGAEAALTNTGRAIREDHHTGRNGRAAARYRSRERHDLSPHGWIGGRRHRRARDHRAYGLADAPDAGQEVAVTTIR